MTERIRLVPLEPLYCRRVACRKIDQKKRMSVIFDLVGHTVQSSRGFPSSNTRSNFENQWSKERERHMSDEHIKLCPEQFTQEVDDDFVCSICNFVLGDPTTACSEGHVFCKVCLTRWQQQPNRNGAKTCPTCRGPLELSPCRLVNSLISKLNLRCKNHQDACDWTGKVAQYEKHLVSCSFEPASCPFGCGGAATKRKRGEENKAILRGQLEQHQRVCDWRPLACLCGAQVQARHKRDHDKSDCPLRKVRCHFAPECKASMAFQQLPQHEASCPQVPVACPLSALGCAARPRRGSLPDHLIAAALQHAELTASAHSRLADEGKRLADQNRAELQRLAAENVKLKIENIRLTACVGRLRTCPSLLAPVSISFRYDEEKETYSESVELFGDSWLFRVYLSGNRAGWKIAFGRSGGDWGGEIERGALDVYAPRTKQDVQDDTLSHVKKIRFGRKRFDEEMKNKLYIIGKVSHGELTRCGETEFHFSLEGCVAKSVELPASDYEADEADSDGDGSDEL
eukprot:g24928.t1